MLLNNKYIQFIHIVALSGTFPVTWPIHAWSIIFPCCETCLPLYRVPSPEKHRCGLDDGLSAPQLCVWSLTPPVWYWEGRNLIWLRSLTPWEVISRQSHQGRTPGLNPGALKEEGGRENRNTPPPALRCLELSWGSANRKASAPLSPQTVGKNQELNIHLSIITCWVSCYCRWQKTN